MDGRKTFLPAVLMRRVWCLALAAAMAAWSCRALADRTTGLAAYKAGDYTSALRELTPPAQAGDAEASYVLGMIYEQGLGVPANDRQAVEWYQAAAVRGHAGAQYMLGVHLQIGLGTTVDVPEAYKWLLLAERGGVPAAKEFLASFAGKMPADDIARATSSADSLCAGGSPACRATPTVVAPPPPTPPAPAPVAVPQPPVTAPPPQVAAGPEAFSGTFVVMRQTPLLERPSPQARRVALLRQWERVVASAKVANDWVGVRAQGKDWVATANLRDEKTAEEAEWSRTNLGDAASLTAFLAHFPKGSHADEASEKLRARRAQIARPEPPTGSKPPPTVAARSVPKKPLDEVSATSSLNRAETQAPPDWDDLIGGDAPPPVSPPSASPAAPLADPPQQARLPGADDKKMPTRLYPLPAPPPAGPEAAATGREQDGTTTGQTLNAGRSLELYDQALSLISAGDLTAAEAKLKEILERHGSDPVAQNAEYRVADIYLRQGDFQKAAAAFQKFRRTYPRSANDPLALLNYAICLGRLGDRSGACKAFKDLGVQYPGLSDETKERKSSEMRQAGCV